MKGNSTSSGFPVFPATKKLQMRDGELPTPLRVNDSVTPPVTTGLVSGTPIQAYGLVKSDGYKGSPDNGPTRVTLAAHQSGKPENVTQGRTYYCGPLKTCNPDTLMDPLFQGETATSVVSGRYARFTPAPPCDVYNSYCKNNQSKSNSKSNTSNSSSTSCTCSTCVSMNSTLNLFTSKTACLDLGEDVSPTLGPFIIQSIGLVVDNSHGTNQRS